MDMTVTGARIQLATTRRTIDSGHGRIWSPGGRETEHRPDEPKDNDMPHFAENANKGLAPGPPDS